MYYRRTAILLGTTCVFLAPALAWTSSARADEPKDQYQEKPFDFEEASRDVPKPREIYPYVKRDMIPMDLKIISDEIVTSDTDPSKKLRKITAHFNSLKLEERVWGHPCVIFMPADNSINRDARAQGQGRHHRLAGLGHVSGARREVRRADRHAHRLSDDGPQQPGRPSRRLGHRRRKHARPHPDAASRRARTTTT